jgi:hypothetical protein
MTTSAATVARLPLLRLGDGEPDQIGEPDPARDAVQQTGQEAEVHAPTELIRGRIRHVSILSVIAAVEFTWVAALGYGLWLVLT